MLETSLPSRETTARTAAQPLPHAPSRPAVREGASCVPARARRPLSAAERMAKSEARLVTMAVACVVIVCGLLVVYLAAYAHITLLGIDQAQMRTSLKQKRNENETLKATLAALQSPDHVTAAALAMGMTCDHRHTYYIAPSATNTLARTAANSHSNSPAAQSGPQVANSGPTDNDNSARND